MVVSVYIGVVCGMSLYKDKSNYKDTNNLTINLSRSAIMSNGAGSY